MSEKYTTIHQHEPLRIPSGWTEQERRLVAQLEELFDDLYRRFNRIRMEDLNKSLRHMITSSSDGLTTLESKVTQTAEKLESLVIESGNYTIYVQADQPIEQLVVGDIWINTPLARTWGDLSTMTWEQVGQETWQEIAGEDEPVSYFWNGSQWTAMADPNQIDRLSTAIEQTARELALKANKGDPATGVETTLVSITAKGVIIKTGGTFTVESGNFELDESGNMSAQNAYLSGDVFSKGHPVLSDYDIYVGSNAPSSPHSGMVWIKPDNSTSAQTTFSKQVTWGDRQNLVNNIRTGTLTGTTTEAVGTVYSYRIRVPVYIREYSNGKTGATLHFDVSTSSGGAVVLAASQRVTIDELGSGNKVIVMTLTSDQWIGNHSSLYFTLYTKQLSGYYAYNVLNSSDNSASITLQCTSKASSGAEGWRDCAVFCYA